MVDTWLREDRARQEVLDALGGEVNRGGAVPVRAAGGKRGVHRHGGVRCVRNQPPDGLQVAGAVRGGGSGWTARPDSRTSQLPAPNPGEHGTRDPGGVVTAFGLGPKKLRGWWLRRHPGSEWPAASTVGAVLEPRHGRTRKRRRPARRLPPHPGRPMVEAWGPNELWTSDFKGEFRTGDGRWCYPLTVADQASRFLLGCRALPSTGMVGVRPAMQRIFEEYGLPRAILTDNGPPFASAAGLGRLSRLSVWWIRLGIVPVLIEPGHPEQNRQARAHAPYLEAANAARRSELSRPAAELRSLPPGVQRRASSRSARKSDASGALSALTQRLPAPATAARVRERLGGAEGLRQRLPRVAQQLRVHQPCLDRGVRRASRDGGGNLVGELWAAPARQVQRARLDLPTGTLGPSRGELFASPPDSRRARWS